MDISETYIKMCEKAEEIQFIKRRVVGTDETYKSFLRGDWVARKNGAVEIITAGTKLESSDNIWLPRQGQLQEMYLKDMPDGTYQKIATLAEEFHDYHEANGYPIYASSMEQLWLAFCMSEKYGKIWSGTGWVKQPAEVK